MEDLRREICHVKSLFVYTPCACTAKDIFHNLTSDTNIHWAVNSPWTLQPWCQLSALVSTPSNVITCTATLNLSSTLITGAVCENTNVPISWTGHYTDLTLVQSPCNVWFSSCVNRAGRCLENSRWASGSVKTRRIQTYIRGWRRRIIYTKTPRKCLTGETTWLRNFFSININEDQEVIVRVTLFTTFIML